MHPRVEYRATCDRYSGRGRKFRGSIPRGRNSSHFSSPFIRPTLPSLSPLFSPLRHQFFFLPPFSTPLSPSPLRSFLPSPPARSRFTILSGPLPLSPPLSPTFIRGSTAQILLFCFPPALLPPLSFVRALACKAGRGSRVFLPTGYRSPRTGRSKQRNEHSPSSSSLPFGGIKHGSAIFRPTLVEIVDISIKFYPVSVCVLCC